jgi:hypothetical protein
MENWMHINDDINAAFYVYNVRDGANNVSQDGRNLWIIGGKVKGNVYGFDYHAEGAFNMGNAAEAAGVQTTKFAGTAVIAKLAYMLETDIATFNPRGMFAWGSGDNQGLNLGGGVSKDKNFYGVNPDFRPGEIFGNSGFTAGNVNTFLAGLAGGGPVGQGRYYRSQLANLTTYNLGIDVVFEALEKCSFMIDYHKFKLSTAPAAVAGNKNIGSEINIAAKHEFNENIMFKLVAAQFYPESLLKNFYAAGNNITKLAAYMSLKFGNNS